MAHFSLNSPLGPLTVFEDHGAVIAVEWGRAGDSETSPLLAEAGDQFNAYFDGRLTGFDLPLEPKGTSFQRAVWGALRRIPHGATNTYGDIAAAIHGGPRAVGGACGRNPIPIIIPCHRVLGKGGRMGGYSGGQGIETKKMLLRLEGCLAVSSGPDQNDG